jgi:hypothetical protein
LKLTQLWHSAYKGRRLKSVLLYMQKLNFGMKLWVLLQNCGAIALMTQAWQMLGANFWIL